MDITEKVAYLKGLMDGLDIDKSTKEGKVLIAIADILDEMALSVSDLESGMAMVTNQMDMMDEDLIEIQEDLYDGDACSCGCGDEDDLFEGELYEVTCPKCGDTICVDEDMLDDGEIDCPNCGEPLEFDLDGELDGFDRGETEDE